MSNKLSPPHKTGKRSEKGKPETLAGSTSKSHKGALLAFAGLAIALVVAYLQLRPQMEVSPKEEIEKSQPFSSPFTIHNSGYLPFRIERTFCYANNIQAAQTTIQDSVATWDTEPRNAEVESGHNDTVFCKWMHSAAPPSRADIVIVIDYAPFGFPATYTSRQYFRFVGAYIDTWQWGEKTTESSTKNAANKAIERALDNLQKSQERLKEPK